MQGVQKVIYDIIKTSREIGLPFISTKAIKVEALKTSLAELDATIVNTKKNQTRKVKKTQLDFSIAQALNSLKNKELVKQTKRGHWKKAKKEA